MTDLSIDLIEYLDKLSMEPDADLLRDSLKMVVQLLKALVNVIRQAYIAGVSTRKMEGVAEELGLNGFDKSRVSRMTKALNDEVEAFRNRSLDKRCAYVWLDALYLKVRQNHRIVSLAFVIALGVDETGHRTILGFDVGAAESGSVRDGVTAQPRQARAHRCSTGDQRCS